MDDLLCFICRAGSFAVVRIDIVLWHGLCRDARYGLGLDHCYGLHTMRRYGHG